MVSDQLSVLIIDDDGERNRHLAHLLASEYQVAQAFTGIEGISLAKNGNPQIIVLDVRLPDIDGFELLKILKTDECTRDIFVVMLSSVLVSDQDQSEGLESGADAYLVYPMSNREFISRIKAVARHKKTFDCLREKENQVNAILENTPDGILVLDTEGKILYANQASRNFFGTDPEALLNLNFGRPVLSPDKTMIDIPRKTGVLTVEMRVIETMIQGETRIIASLHDITSHKISVEKMSIRVEELLSRTSQNDKLLSVIAHDLKAPFNFLLNMSEYLSNSLEELSGSEIRKYLDGIHTSSEKIFTLLLNLLDWSRINIGHVKQYPVLLNLQTVTAKVLSLYTEMAASRGIDMINSVPTGIMVFADENIITSVLRNLVANALKFSSQGSKILVNADIKEGWVKLRVADTGIGMTPGTLEKLFRKEEIGEKIHPESGTGLGLILCHELMEVIGGRIEVMSDYGQGTTVILGFPGKN